MTLTPLGRAALVSREALKTTAYKDSVGVWTIGVGHTSAAGPPKVTPGLTITEAEALTIFDRDLAQYEAAVDKAVTVLLADHERDALVSICYNIGPAGLARSTFVKRLNAGDRAGAAAAIMAWTKPKEVTSRREAERDQFLTPYEVAAPKARSNDRVRVKAGGARSATTAKSSVVQPSAAISAPRVDAAPPAAPTIPWWGRLLGIKPPAVSRPGLSPKGSAALWDVQKALRDRAYYTKGLLDGLDGGLTQGAVAQARKDNGMGDGGIDDAFLAALPTMPPRPVSTARANISLTKAAEYAPEVFQPLKWLGGIGLGSLGLGGADTAGLFDKVQTVVTKANDIADSTQTGFATAGHVVGFLADHKGLLFVALGLLIVIWVANKLLDAWIKVRTAFL